MISIESVVYPKIGDKTVRIAATWLVSIVGVGCNTSCNTSGDIRRLIISLCIFQERSREGRESLGTSVTSIHKERLALVRSLHL